MESETDIKQSTHGDRLAIEKIRLDGGTQSRVSVNGDAIDDYADKMQNGTDFPAIDVFYDGETYWLADGFHRVNAAKKAGLTDIDAVVHLGTQRDALLYGFGSNNDHGVRKSNADKRAQTEKMLSDDEWCKWSQADIARHIGVTPEYVSRLKKDLSIDRSIDSKTVERGGKTYEMNTAGQQRARTYKDTQEQPPEEPSVSPDEPSARVSGFHPLPPNTPHPLDGGDKMAGAVSTSNGEMPKTQPTVPHAQVNYPGRVDGKPVTAGAGRWQKSRNASGRWLVLDGNNIPIADASEERLADTIIEDHEERKYLTEQIERRFNQPSQAAEIVSLNEQIKTLKAERDAALQDKAKAEQETARVQAKFDGVTMLTVKTPIMTLSTRYGLPEADATPLLKRYGEDCLRATLTFVLDPAIHHKSDSPAAFLGMLLDSLQAEPEKQKPGKVTHKAKAKPEKTVNPRHAEITELMATYLQFSGVIDPDLYAKPTQRNKFEQLVKAGITPDLLQTFIAGMRCDRFWKDKAITVEKMMQDIQPWLNAHQPDWKTGGQPVKEYDPNSPDLPPMLPPEEIAKVEILNEQIKQQRLAKQIFPNPFSKASAT